MNLGTSLLVVLAALIVVACLILRPERWLSRNALPASARRRLADRLPWWRALGDRRRARLITRIAALQGSLSIIGGDGLTPSEEQRLLITAQLALCSLAPDATTHDLPHEIIIYPDVTDGQEITLPSDLIEDLGELATGDGWASPRLAVSWRAFERALAGDPANPLVRSLIRWRVARRAAARSASDSWLPAFEQAHEQWRSRTGDDLLGLSSDADLPRFVAAAAETFFQRGKTMAREQPALYDLMAAGFDFDTARRRPSGHRTPRIRPRRA